MATAPSDGWHASFSYSAPDIPAYALRTRDGGALVFFALAQNSSWTTTSSKPKFSGGPNAFDGRMPITVAIDAGLSNPSIRPGTRFTSTYVFETMAVDPARGRGKIALLSPTFDGGGVISATMS